jgi:hypothetical protein
MRDRSDIGAPNDNVHRFDNGDHLILGMHVIMKDTSNN